MSNEQQKNATAEFDFTKLYSKSRFLRAIEEASGSSGGCSPKQIKPTRQQRKRRSRKINLNHLNSLVQVKFAGRILTSLKRISINYTENATASIYGYTDSTRVLGMNFKSNAPGLGFIFGRQPDTSFINTLAQKA